MMKYLLSFFAILFGVLANAQNIGINGNGATPHVSAMLDIDVSALPANGKRGLLIPRMSTAERIAIAPAASANGLIVYDQTTSSFWYWNSTVWVPFLSATTGWTTLGNAGTTATNNFIGTTDANDWVIKTGGSAATNERARFLSSGQLVVNNVGLGANTNDIFSVYATGTTNGTTSNTNPLGTRAINGYTATGFGLFGNTTGNTNTTFGVVGNASSTTGPTTGVRGEAASINGTGASGIGNTSLGAVTTGTVVRGVLGQVNGTLAGTAVGIGVHGLASNTMTLGDARGVEGDSPANDGTGVAGFSSTTATTAFPTGVLGQAASSTGTGVVGVATATGLLGGPVGVFGFAGSDVGTGVYGQVTSTTVLANPIGVTGDASSSIGFGVDGFNRSLIGTGVLGEGNNLIGTFLTNGGGGAFTGATNGSFSRATTVASGTGVIGVGNGVAINTLATGSGGAFTGANVGGYNLATTVASGTGVVGAGNNAAFATLAAGSGGAFTGTGVGGYNVANTVASGTGVVGVGNNALPASLLAAGSGGAFTGNAVGSFSTAKTVASGTGVIGAGNNVAANTLVGGSGGAFSGTTTGSYGFATTVTSGTGVIGVGNNTTVSTLANGSGGAFTGTNVGSYNVANTATGTGAIGVGNNALPALLMTSGSGLAGTGTAFGVYGAATSTADGVGGTPARAGGYFESGSGASLSYTYVACYEGAGTPRKVMGNGTVNTVVENEQGQHVLLSAPEAPENLFQDYGTATLVNGRVHVDLDPTLSRNILVDERHPLRAFVQLRGDCKGVYVTNETSTGFDIVELQGGTSNSALYWTVTANRANKVCADGVVWPFAEERFALTVGPQARTEQTGLSPSPVVQVSQEAPNVTAEPVQQNVVSRKDHQRRTVPSRKTGSDLVGEPPASTERP